MKPRRIISAARLSMPFASALVALLAVSSASAQLYWDANAATAGAGGTPTGTWGTSAFWNTTAAGTAGTFSASTANTDNLFFVAGPSASSGNGNTTITINGARVANSLTFQHSGNFTLSGGTSITLGDGTPGSGGITLNQLAFGSTNQGAVSIGTALVLNNSQTWTNNGQVTTGGSSGSLTINNTLNLGAHTLTFSGSGITSFGTNGTTPVISGTGGITVNSGRVWLASGGAPVHTYSGATTLNGGVTMIGIGGANGISANSNLVMNGGILESYWTTGMTRTQGTGAGQIQITGGESGFSMNGAQGATFNIGAVTWGSSTFDPSKFVLNSQFSQSGAAVTFSSAINLNGANRTIIANNGIAGNVSATISGAITNGTGTAGLIKEGAGLLALTSTNTYNGGTTISAGTLAFGGTATMPSSGAVAVASGATLGINLGGAGNWTTGTSGVGTLGGLLSGLGGAGTSTVSYTGDVGLRLNMGANSTYSGNIGNVGTSLALTKVGTSSLTLSGNNSYSGGTFIQQGTLSANSANALGTAGDITFRGGTLQYTANSAANDYGSRIKNSTSAITLDTNSQNVSLSGMTAGNTGGLTKSGAGILTFTGTNTYSGATTLNAGTIAIYDGTLTTSGGAVNMVSNTSISVLGGAVNSTWNVGGEFGPNGNSHNNVQVLIDGDGTAGSARVIGVSNLIWGRSASNSTLTLTDGGQMNVTGEVRIGNTYYNTNGNSNITIGGGTATSTFSGDGGDDFYIGYGERENSNNNVVTVSTGGVLTNIRDMFVGHVNNQQGNDLASTANKLTVTGTGTASMRGISIGYAQQAGAPPTHPIEKANANVVEVTNGGTLTTSGAVNIGRAAAASTESNANTMTVTGTGSSWAAGSQNVFVGLTANASAVSNNNILTVGAGATVTGIATLTVGSGAGTETGNQLVVNGILTATTVTVSAGNSLSGSGTINGAVTVNGNLNPGTSPGELNFGNSLALANTTTTTMEINGTTLGLTYDNIDVGSALTYDGILTLAIGATFGSSTVFDLFEFGSETGSFDSVALTGSYTGTLVNNGLGVWETTTNLGNETWSFSQATGDLTLTVIPEPSSAALFGTLGAMLLFRRRR